MFRFMKWRSPAGDSKGVDFVESMPAVAKAHHPTLVERPTKNQLKRKRGQDEPRQSDNLSSRDITTSALVDRRSRNGQVNTVQSGQVQHRSTDKLANSKVNGLAVQSNGQITSVMDQKLPEGEDARTSQPRTPLLQQTISTQIGHEIMIKHRELRLIEQEVAKCQVALEQLRRCELIPFPTTSNDVNSMQDVVNGEGSLPEQELHQFDMPWRPPWGVSDGPYSRHYARWLLPDPRFDGASANEPSLAGLGSGKGVGDGRNRHGAVDTAGNKTRPHRGASGGKLHALSSGYPQPKDKSTPLLVKRASDNQWVKLICVDCDRGDFSSAQGFINHCRIAHHRGFESHDAAAAVCGQPVELDEHGGIVGAEEINTGGGPALVHPLIRSATEERPSLLPPPSEKPSESAQLPPPPREVKKKKRGKNAKNSSKTQPTFIPSSDTPYLSTLMEQRGLGLDLSNLVEESQRIDDIQWPSSSEDEADDEGEANPTSAITAEATPTQNPLSTPSEAAVGGSSRVPGRAGMSPAPLGLRPPNSSKGVDKGSAAAQHRTPGLSSISPRVQQTPVPVPVAPRTRHALHHIPVHPVSPPTSNTPSPTLPKPDSTPLALPDKMDEDSSSYEAASPSTSASASEVGSDAAAAAEAEVDDEESGSEEGESASGSEEEEEEDDESGSEEVSAPATPEPDAMSIVEEDDDDEEGTASTSSANSVMEPATPPPPPRQDSAAKVRDEKVPRRGALRSAGAPPRRGAGARHVSFQNEMAASTPSTSEDSGEAIAKKGGGGGGGNVTAKKAGKQKAKGAAAAGGATKKKDEVLGAGRKLRARA